MLTAKQTLSCPLLLACATAIAAVSLFVPQIVSAMPPIIVIVASFVPFALGGLSMLLCFTARQRTRHKRLVIAYTVALAPFAFSYPALMAYLVILYLSGRYTGPMP